MGPKLWSSSLTEIPAHAQHADLITEMSSMKEFRPALAHLLHRTKPTQTPFATLPFFVKRQRDIALEGGGRFQAYEIR
jgi:hypothetical protein